MMSKSDPRLSSVGADGLRTTFELARTKGGPTKRFAIVASALALLGLILMSWRFARVSVDAAVAASTPVEVATESVRSGIHPIVLDAIGSLEAVRQVNLASEVAGRIVDLRFVSGSLVHVGDELVQLFDEPDRAELESLKAQAAFARNQLVRSQTLAPSGAQTKVTFDQHQSESDQAEAAVRRTQSVIRQKTVRAPFSGTIGLRRVNVGQYVNAGEVIATLTDLDALFANFTVPQRFLSELSVGRDVVVKSDAFPEREFEGPVTAIEPQVGTDTRNVTLQATLQNPGHLLRPGMYVQVRLTTAAPSEVLTIPDTALQTSAEGETVMVVSETKQDATGIVTVRKVRSGRRIGDRVVVLDGVKAGEKVVTSGQNRLFEGENVHTARIERQYRGATR